VTTFLKNKAQKVVILFQSKADFPLF
jgi:hypothetical protein